MHSLSLSKLLTIAISCILCTTVVAFLWILSRTYHQYSSFSISEKKLQQKIEISAKKAATQEAYLHRLINDPEFFEHVVRKRLGYSKPDEIIFRFDDN